MRTQNRCVALTVLIVFLAAGCATTPGGAGLSEREAGGLVGAGTGAGLGAIIGSATGNAAAGVAIGTPFGLLIGALIGEGMRQQKAMTRREVDQLKQQMTQAGYQTELYVPKETDQAGEVHLKYNPKTGQIFPPHYQHDPVTGAKLEYVKSPAAA